MTWSLSEFIGLIDVRSVCWGVVELGRESGFHVRAADSAIFYAVLDGKATLQTSPGSGTQLASGDCAIVLSNAAHAIRAGQASAMSSIEFLENDEYGDMPRFLTLTAQPMARIVCGRLKLRWPAGLDPQHLPAIVHTPAHENVVDFQRLLLKSRSFGSSAVLTRAAALVLISALKEDQDVQQTFRDANFRDPIARAVQYMKLHPHRPWSVETLASKVGMARSTFAARFQEEAGTPPMEALTEIRMQTALDLLAKTDLKLADIAERVGYSSLSAFSRRFEKSFGTTPGRQRFRRRDDERASARGRDLNDRSGASDLASQKQVNLDAGENTSDRAALSSWSGAAKPIGTWEKLRGRH